MDLNTADSLHSLQSQGLAEPWNFQGRAGYRLKPTHAAQVARLLYWAQESNRKIAASVQGALLMPEPLWLDCSQLKAIRKYPVDDFIIQVEAGIRYGELSQQLASNWQTLPLTYPVDKPIGDILAQDEPSLETGLRGYPRDFVLKTEIATPDGNLTISGADVVKNATGYDLAKLYVGGQHTFGVITAVTFKLLPLPQNHRQYLYTLPSLHEAYTLAEKLLASSLPLSICEIFQQDGAWRLFIEICGEDWTLVECQASLAQLSQHAWQGLTEATVATVKTHLQSWNTNETVLEIALPISRCAIFASTLSQQSTFANTSMQIRPAAGLIYIRASIFPSPALRYLKFEAQQAGGFVQIRQIAKSDVANFADALALFEEMNLPEDPTVRGLLKALKKGYDPNGILFTPSLPI
jgi:hypothetical protein